MDLERPMVLGGRSLGLSALSPCHLGSRLLGKRASWLVQSAGTLALIPAQPNFHFRLPTSVSPFNFFYKYDLDPIVGIGLAGNDNWIRAVANSLRLPLKNGPFLRRHCLNPMFAALSSVFVTLRRDQSAFM